MNNSFTVYEKILKEERKDWHLYVDAVYRANPHKLNFSSEVPFAAFFTFLTSIAV